MHSLIIFKKILKKCNTSSLKTFKNYSSTNPQKIFNKQQLIHNKDFASKHRDNKAFRLLYDINLINLLNSLQAVNKKFDKIVFIGPNPEIVLQNLPSGKIVFLFIFSFGCSNIYIL